MQTGNPDAKYAVLGLHDFQWQVNVRDVPYDSQAMVERAKASG